MKKTIFILAAGLAVLGVGLVLIGSIEPKVPLAELPVRTVVRNARPLVWLDERIMLAGINGKIVKLDTRDARIVEVLHEPYYPGEQKECFSRKGGRFAVTAAEKNLGGTSYANMVYRWVPDWDRPDQFEDRKLLELGGSNPLDCTNADYRAPASNEEQSAEPLLRAADGRTRVYYRGSGLESPHERIVQIERDGHTSEVWLETTPRFVSSQIQVRSSFDEASGSYLWYLSTRDFNRDSRHWPIKAWWVAPEGMVTSVVILPRGPWIKPFSTLYILRFFSCGPECYSHMRMWAGHGQIYIAVWGRAVDAGVRGVYWLNVAGKSWEKIIAGELDSGLVLSPSGCQIGYAVDGRFQILTVCEAGS